MVNKVAAKNTRIYNRDTKVRHLERKFGTPEYTRIHETLVAALRGPQTRKSVRFVIGSLVHLRGVRPGHARALVFDIIRNPHL